MSLPHQEDTPQSWYNDKLQPRNIIRMKDLSKIELQILPGIL